MPVIVAVLIIGNFLDPAFLTADNLMNVLQLSSELSVLVVAESLILICGKFDLSLESTVSLAPIVAAWLMIKDCSIGGSGVGSNGHEGIAVVLVLGLLIGLINGLLVVKLKLNASSRRSLS
jgi:simple sugar transport system permease protein